MTLKNKSTWKVHNPRSHYNYLRIVNFEKYTVLGWFQYCVIRHEEEAGGGGG